MHYVRNAKRDAKCSGLGALQKLRKFELSKSKTFGVPGISARASTVTSNTSGLVHGAVDLHRGNGIRMQAQLPGSPLKPADELLRDHG